MTDVSWLCLKRKEPFIDLSAQNTPPSPPRPPGFKRVLKLKENIRLEKNFFVAISEKVVQGSVAWSQIHHCPQDRESICSLFTSILTRHD